MKRKEFNKAESIIIKMEQSGFIGDLNKDRVFNLHNSLLFNSIKLNELTEKNLTNSPNDLSLLSLSRENVVINLVTYVEGMLKCYIKEFPGLILLNPQGVNKLLETSISLKDVLYLQDKDLLNKGGIIAATKNFQNLEKIQEIFTQLLNCNFLGELGAFDFSNGNMKNCSLNNKFDDWRGSLERLFSIRHKIIHNYASTFELSKEDVNHFFSIALRFIRSTGNFIWYKLGTN